MILQTLNTGSLFYATLNALSYFYMVSYFYNYNNYYRSCIQIMLLYFPFQVCSWGGYTFIINLIPMHVLLCIVTGRYSSRLYIAYAPLVSLQVQCHTNLYIQMSRRFFITINTMQVVLGTLLAALVPVVGFNAVMTSEHFASFLVCPLRLYRTCSFLS